ncbi:hypothetical protein CCYA_CCYA03G0812 [Cyanidiococcus yangmingshanensis]|nr:hypothetical protein CCYA_CCYA03G0812 [Cyanidiococcus yangmingshanensis]
MAKFSQSWSVSTGAPYNIFATRRVLRHAADVANAPSMTGLAFTRPSIGQHRQHSGQLSLTSSRYEFLLGCRLCLRICRSSRSSQTLVLQRRGFTKCSSIVEPARYSGSASLSMRMPRASPSMAVTTTTPSTVRGALLPCTRYVVFSDLHVELNRLDTCLQVLEHVHQVACANGAGIVFLGDFWHVRGSIPVICLNRVLEAVQRFTRPVLMIPGNHDQVTICGREHALVPVAAAMPPGLAHVIEQPTVLFDALWLPYRKRNEELIEALRAHGPHVKAVFCHAEIRGAWMNNHLRYDGHSGLEPELFPLAPVPTYSGHFHRPHLVPGYPQIRYVGSPYQVTRSEEGQQKQLLILRSSDWRVERVLPLDLGPRFFSVSLAQARKRLRPAGKSPADDKQPELNPWRAGDRVTLLCSSLQTLRAAQSSHDAKRELELIYRELRRQGIQASMRIWDAETTCSEGLENPTSTTFVGHRVRLPDAERLDPSDILRLYARKYPQEVDPQALELGLQILEQVRTMKTTSRSADQSRSQRSVRLVFESVRMHNFGCFLTAPLESGTKEVIPETTLGANRSAPTFAPNNPQSNGAATDGVVVAIVEDRFTSGKTLSRQEEQEKVGFWYPLHRRGIVLVSGRNMDEDGCNSNGTGKTTLAMAALWALTGCLEPRQHLRRNVSQLRILHEDATDGFVELRARVNDKPLLVRRRVRRSGKQRERLSQELFVEYDSVNLSGLSIDDTQQRLDRLLDPSLLHHAVFFGQSLMNDLLSATDKEFKEILDIALPLQVWNEAYAQVTAQQRAIGDEREQLRRQIQGWQQEVEREQGRIKQFQQTEQDTLMELDQQERELKGWLQRNRGSETVAASSPDDISDQGCFAALEDAVRELNAQVAEGTAVLANLQQREASLRAELAQARKLWDQWAELDQMTVSASGREHRLALQETSEALKTKLSTLERKLQELRLDEERISANVSHLDRLLRFRYSNDDNANEDMDGGTTDQRADSETTLCALCLQSVNAVSYEARLQTLRDERQALCEKLFSITEQRHEIETETVSTKRALEETNTDLAQRQTLEQRLEAVSQVRPSTEHMKELTLAWNRCEADYKVLARELQGKRQALQDYERHLQHQQQLAMQRRQCKDDQSRILQQLEWIRQQRQRVIEPLVTAIRQANERLASLRRAIEQARTRNEALEHECTRLQRLERVFHRGGIPSYLLDQSLQVIETLCRQYLQHLSDDTLLLRIRRRRVQKTSRSRQNTTEALLTTPALEVIVWQVYCRDSKTGAFRERELGLLSGGQFRRVSLALSLAFAEYLCHQIGYSSNLLVLDEILQQLDQEGARRLATLLPLLERDTVLVIAHENVRYLADVADAHDVVERSAGQSTVLCDLPQLDEPLHGDSWPLDMASSTETFS